MGSPVYNGIGGQLSPITSRWYRGPTVPNTLASAQYSAKGAYFAWAVTSQNVNAWYQASFPGNNITGNLLNVIVPLRWGLRRAAISTVGPMGS